MKRKLITTELRKVLDRIDAGASDIPEEDMMEMFAPLLHVSITREESAELLNMPLSTFDKQVKAGKLPKSHKRKGLTEKLWYKDEIIKCVK